MRFLVAPFTLAALLAQPRSFDTYTFTPPSGYTAREAKSQVELARLDPARRFFCQFLLQVSQPTKGSAAQDIDAEWNIVLGSTYQIKGQPTTAPLAFPGAPDSIIRTAATSTAGVPSLLSNLIVLRFPGRYIGVLFNASNQEAINACQSDLTGLLRSIQPSAAPATPAAPPTSYAIPTGNTPRLFPGTPGWLPSGSGLPIPDPAILQGRPVGLWYLTTTDGRGLMKPVVHVFLDGGIRASSPRPGGPRLFDLDGQRQQAGATGAGTYSIENGQFIQRYDGFENRGAFRTGSDSAGIYFKSGEALYRPLAAVTPQSIAGRWRSTEAEITFRPDGTFQYAAGKGGRYQVDGYLMRFIPDGAPGWIDRVGLSGDLLVFGTLPYFRVR